MEGNGISILQFGWTSHNFGVALTMSFCLNILIPYYLTILLDITSKIDSYVFIRMHVEECPLYSCKNEKLEITYLSVGDEYIN